jgi:hypothetical protein
VVKDATIRGPLLDFDDEVFDVHGFFPAFLRAFSAMSIAMATAWLCGLPDFTSLRMFSVIVFCE